MARCNGSQRRNADEFNHRGHRGAFASSFFLHPSYFLQMTLGRTSSGAIKIKTDGGLRAVNCACCDLCSCFSAPPINPLDDPDFTKKLRGDDPSVSAFTRVSITFSISAEGVSASGTLSGDWVDAIGCDEPGKTFSGDDCDEFFSDFCFGTCLAPAPSTGLVTLRLQANGCLTAQLEEAIQLNAFFISTEQAADCAFPLEDQGISITINGANTYKIREIDNSDDLTGSLDITFS
jgi:hypothetical protein